jgi:hypothetical protein
MAINLRHKKDGTVRYEARLSCRRFSGCRRFDTREEAEKQIVQWKESREKAEFAGPEAVDLMVLQNKFLLNK